MGEVKSKENSKLRFPERNVASICKYHIINMFLLRDYDG